MAARKSPQKKPEVNVDDLSILQRINGVMGELSYIRKTKTIGKGSYAYNAVTHDEVTKKLHPLLHKYGIVVVPHLVQDNTTETGTITSGGTPIIRYEAVYDVRFYGKDTSDCIVSRVSAHALDQGDKAPGKAASYAVKYAVLKVFALETGDEEEVRLDQQPGPLTKQQVEDLQILTEELGFPVDETLQSLAEKVYRAEDIESVPAQLYEDAVRRLKKKAADAKRNAKRKQEPEPEQEENAFGE